MSMNEEFPETPVTIDDPYGDNWDADWIPEELAAIEEGVQRAKEYDALPIEERIADLYNEDSEEGIRWKAWTLICKDFIGNRTYDPEAPRFLHFESSLCTICQFFSTPSTEPEGTGACAAYDPIPAGIWFSSKGHREPMPNDKGIQFKPLTDWQHYADPDYIPRKLDEARKELAEAYGEAD